MEGKVFGYVYMITNEVNDKRYVGLTTRCVNQRFKEHCVADSVIGEAIRKYGKDNFIIEKIDVGYSEEDLKEKEIYWIDYHNSFGVFGYNLTPGGDFTYQRIPVLITERQKKVLMKIEKWKKANPIDIHNDEFMIKSIVYGFIEAYILCDSKVLKSRVAKKILRFIPEILNQILGLGILEYDDLKYWATI